MNKTIKRNVVVSALLAIMLCVSLIAGATFALFTSESKANIAVTSGKVSVTATVDDLMTYSMGNATKENGVFDNYGTASFSSEQKLLLDKMTPGDKATFNVKIQNNGNVATSYRIKMYVNGDLASALVATATVKESTIALSNVENVTEWTMFDGNETVIVPMVVELPLATGNEYQDKSATVTIVVEAIQGNGAGAILVDGKAYATFDEAIKAAGENGTIQISGTVELPAVDGVNKVTDLQNVTIEGLDYATLVFVNYPGSNDSGTGSFANMTLKNLTVVDETYYTAENGENAWEFTYLEFTGENAFENVVFSDGIMVEAPKKADGTSWSSNSVFTNCTFIGHNNDSSVYGNVTMYGAWVHGGKATFEGCTFTGTRGLKVHEQYGSNVESVLVKNCIFENLSEKPGVVIGTVGANEVMLEGCSFKNTQAGDGASDPTKGIPFVYETDSAHPVLLNNQYTSVYDEKTEPTAPAQSGDVYHITNAAEFVEYITVLNCGTASKYSSAKAVLDCNVDLNGHVFYVSGEGYAFDGSFDGQGHTVSNFSVERTDNHLYTGLFCVYAFNNEGRIGLIQNLKVSNAMISGAAQTSVIATVEEGCSIINCHVSDCTVKGEKKVGAVSGYNHGGTVKDCTATNCNVYATDNRADQATVFGYDNGGTFTNNTATNCNVYYGYEEIVDGVVKSNGEYLISNANGLVYCANTYATSNATKGKVFKLTNDIDMSGIAWTPWCNQKQYFCGTFDGQNYTIKNLTIHGEHESNDGYAVGFIGRLGVNGNDKETIKNVKFDKATVTGNHFVAVVVGYNEFGIVENIRVSNSSVTATHANKDQCGDKAGILIGMCGPNNKYIEIKNCSATNCTVKAARDAGQLIGMLYTKDVQMADLSATNVTVSEVENNVCEDKPGANITAEIVGRQG